MSPTPAPSTSATTTDSDLGRSHATLSDTVIPSAAEAEVVPGAETLIITLTNDTWDVTVGADNAITTALIAGIELGEPRRLIRWSRPVSPSST